MPAKFAELGIAGRLDLLEEVLPGISTCERVEYRSSSARVLGPGVAPGRTSHAWIKVSDPSKVEVLRAHVRVEAELHGLSFPSPRHSSATGEVIDHARLTLVDTSVWGSGRMVFISKPTLSADLQRDRWIVNDAYVHIVNEGGGALDLSHVTVPESRPRQGLP